MILLHHPALAEHDEANIVSCIAPDRVARIAAAVQGVEGVKPLQAKPATDAQILRAHAPEYWALLQKEAPGEDGTWLELTDDTLMNHHTLRAIRLSAGAACQGAGLLLDGKADHAYAAILAGHHACKAHGEGFCFLSNAAIAALDALEQGAGRVAILDFDTHSGNGTIACVHDNPDILFAETYQADYPGPIPAEELSGTIRRDLVKSPEQWRAAWKAHLPEIADFDPDLLILSAGYDAHKSDPLGKVGLSDDDFAWLLRGIKALKKPTLALLEGGYDIDTTARLAAAHAAFFAK